MKDLHHVLNEIIKLTTIIETNYPELYRSLDENPLTIPAINHPHIDKQDMVEYWDRLTQLLKHHLDSYKNNSQMLDQQLWEK